ncbi:MAG: T9SS type A sorting domain-containing protein, partial [Ignavibacteria bacterium]
AQNPSYNLYAHNFSLSTVNQLNDKLEFDIHIEHTNPPVNFEYAGGQYFIKINPLVANGGTMAYSIIGSDLPINLQPRSPSVGSVSSPSATVLRLAVNTFPGSGNGYNMTGIGLPGVKIVRMRLLNSTSFNTLECFQLEWRNPPIVAFVTKIFAYAGILNTDVTTPVSHYLNTDKLNFTCIQPVELTAFSSIVNKNIITLNWSTSEEINNKGFDVERKYSEGVWSKVRFIEGQGNTLLQHDYTFSDRGLISGNYNYRLKQIDFNGNHHYYYLSNEIEIGNPNEFSISQNYPNPFNPNTRIDFDIPENSKVVISVYDISGKEIASLLNEQKPAGYYSVYFNAGNFSSGMYFYRMTTDKGFIAVRKMLFLK